MLRSGLVYLVLSVFAVSDVQILAVELPKVLDDRLKLELIAAEPQIVTPTGIAVDQRGRILVVECHTHFRPENYVGPTSDRIRQFSDPDGDGTFDRVTTFFEGTSSTMNVAVDHVGDVFVATRNEVFRLRDRNDDGVSDEKTTILRLETTGDYPHNGLSGFAFDLAGQMYIGMGENLGVPYRLIGSDGAELTGREGGHIFRCRLDGSKLERFATGFWNPFHVALDGYGRLFTVDNDPDSLPPCRLIHVVPGGNYGYKFRNGRKGLHPFTAWNGELPGTLPMVAGTGEAPSGLVVYQDAALPGEYRDAILVTSWGDHRIELYRPDNRGASVRAKMQPVVQGSEDFRPVGIAVAPDGSLFFSDWVDKSYPVHGRGRIWRLSAKQPQGTPNGQGGPDDLHAAHVMERERVAIELASDAASRRRLEALVASDSDATLRRTAFRALARETRAADARLIEQQPTDELRALAVDLAGANELGVLLAREKSPAVRAAALRRITDPSLASAVWPLVEDADPFVAQAARQGLSRIYAEPKALWSATTTTSQRIAAALILRERNDELSRELLPTLARDSSAEVRFTAVQWIGEEELAEYRSELDAAIAGRSASQRLFAGYLAALERLSGNRRDANDEWSPQQYLVAALLGDNTSADVRRYALRMLPADHSELTAERLASWIHGNDAATSLEAIRSLRLGTLPSRGELLLKLVQDERRPLEHRAEAVLGLSGNNRTERKQLLEFAASAEPSLRHEALRSLRGKRIDETEKTRLNKSADSDLYAQELIAILEQRPGLTPPSRRDDTSAWERVLEPHKSDARRGERVFFHPSGPGCYRCHAIDGRGGEVGPDLSQITSGADRARLLQAIVQPSREIAPQFTTWNVRTGDGKVITGILLGEDASGVQTYGTADGSRQAVRTEAIEERQASSQSIMPENVSELMTAGELADLMAFLQERG